MSGQRLFRFGGEGGASLALSLTDASEEFWPDNAVAWEDIPGDEIDHLVVATKETAKKWKQDIATFLVRESMVIPDGMYILT